MKILSLVFMVLSLSANAQTYVNGVKVSDQAQGTDIEMVDGEIYIDGKLLDDYIDEATEEVNEPEAKEIKKDPNLYQTKNVDAYNKWYNEKGKKMIEENNKKTKNIFLWIFGSLGAVTLFITLGFVYVEIKQRIQKFRSQRVPSEKIQKLPKEKKPKIPAPKWSSPLHHDMSLPEVDSPIQRK